MTNPIQKTAMTTVRGGLKILAHGTLIENEVFDIELFWPDGTRLPRKLVANLDNDDYDRVADALANGDRIWQ